MSNVKNFSSFQELKEDLLYHASEASFYLAQYHESCEEAKRCWHHYIEHKGYQESIELDLSGDSHAI